jgi:hypothetical protein
MSTPDDEANALAWRKRVCPFYGVIKQRTNAIHGAELYWERTAARMDGGRFEKCGLAGCQQQHPSMFAMSHGHRPSGRSPHEVTAPHISVVREPSPEPMSRPLSVSHANAAINISGSRISSELSQR